MFSVRSVSASASASLDPIPDASRRDPIKDQLDSLIGDRRVLVFSGFSGLGYKDAASLDLKLNQLLDEASADHGAHNLMVVAGATSDGIGRVYELASKKGIATLGIVSEQARGQASRDCHHVVYVPDPQNTWQVLDEKGSSYMVEVARNGGTFYALGGGSVTLGELNEAKALGVKTQALPDFEPHPDQVARRRAKDPEFDPTPVRTAHYAGRSPQGARV